MLLHASITSLPLRARWYAVQYPNPTLLPVTILTWFFNDERSLTLNAFSLCSVDNAAGTAPVPVGYSGPFVVKKC